MNLQEIYIGKYLLSLIRKLLPKRKKKLLVEKPEYIGMDLFDLQNDFPDCEIYEFNDGGLKYLIEVPNENGALILIFDYEFKCIQSNFYHKDILHCS